MLRRWSVAAGGLVLLFLLAWSSFAAAAPAAKSTPISRSALTATRTATPKSTRTRRPTVTPSATAKNTPVPVASPTATPTATVSDGGDAGEPLAPDIEAAALTPVAPGVMTSKIIVFNPNSTAANVGITILKTDGSTAAIIQTFKIVANGAVVKPLPSTLGSPFNGSAVVSSDKAIQSYVLNSTSGNPPPARDEYNGGAPSSSTLALPLVRHLANVKQNSLIAVQNTSTTAGSVTLHLYDPTGTEVVPGTVVSVNPSASSYFNTDSLFPSSTFTGSGLLVAGPGLTIAAAEQTKYYKDTASFSGLGSADAANTLYLPFVERRRNASNGILSWSEIFVRNNGASSTDVKLQLYKAGGGLGPAVTRPGVLANGQAQFLLNTSEFISLTGGTTSYFSGWGVVTSTGQPLSAFVLDAQNSGARLFGFSGVSPAQLGTKYACGDTFRISTPSQNSKINLVNFGASAANVTIKLFKPSTGASAGTKTYSVGAKRLVIANLTDTAFTAAGSSFEGLATVSSSSPNIVVSVNTQYSSGGITSINCARLQ